MPLKAGLPRARWALLPLMCSVQKGCRKLLGDHPLFACVSHPLGDAVVAEVDAYGGTACKHHQPPRSWTKKCTACTAGWACVMARSDYPNAFKRPCSVHERRPATMCNTESGKRDHRADETDRQYLLECPSTLSQFISCACSLLYVDLSAAVVSVRVCWQRWHTEYRAPRRRTGWTSTTDSTGSASSSWGRRSMTSWPTRSSVFCWCV